jgi:hypothetical protein
VPIDTGDSHANGSVAFVLDAADAIHVAYSDQDGLAYATNRTGDWGVEAIAPGGYGGSIVVGDGVVHVAYIGGVDGHVRYATRTCQ